MARKNKFADANEDFLSDLGQKRENTFTSTLVEKLEQSVEVKYGKPTDFKPYPDSKLRLELHKGEKYERLKESIETNGIMQPIIVDEDMVILAGHNRVAVAKDIGIDVPYIIKSGLTENEKELVCIDTNLLNRQINEYVPSQLAYIIKVKVDAEKHQGVSSHGEIKLTGEKVGEEYNLSNAQIYRYVKLNSLSKYGKEMLDRKAISMRFAYELAFFDEQAQDFILESRNLFKVNDTTLKQIKQEMKNEKFEDSEQEIIWLKNQLMNFSLTNKKSHVIDYRNIREYIPSYIKTKDVEAYVIRALQNYSE